MAWQCIIRLIDVDGLYSKTDSTLCERCITKDCSSFTDQHIFWTNEILMLACWCEQCSVWLCSYHYSCFQHQQGSVWRHQRGWECWGGGDNHLGHEKNRNFKIPTFPLNTQHHDQVIRNTSSCQQTLSSSQL